MNNLPKVTKNLLIINIIVFFATVVANRWNLDLNELLGLHYFQSSHFKLHQLFTYMFMHSNFEHIFFNMFAVWMFGRILEQVWGSSRFLFYYVVCGVGAGLVQELTQFVAFMPYIKEIHALQAMDPTQLVTINGAVKAASEWLPLFNAYIGAPTVGASGAVYGILLAFGMLFPNQQLYIIPFPFPIKAKWLIIAYFVIELGLAFLAKGDHVAHFAHLGGMIFGLLLILYWRKHNRSNGYYQR